MRFTLPPLYPIIDLSTCSLPLQKLLEIFSDAGVNLIQLREKKSTSRQFYEDALRLMAVASKYQMTVIVNDRVDIARLTGAQGVHLGQQDLPIEEGRRLLGEDMIIGVSSHNIAQAQEAEQSSADYVAIGPLAATTSKEKPDPVVPLKDLRAICLEARKPLVGIGGITPDNARSFFEMGIHSVAVIGGLFSADDLGKRVREFLKCAAV
jgi:thiamine-phosphate pyrophosphorylase